MGDALSPALHTLTTVDTCSRAVTQFKPVVSWNHVIVHYSSLPDSAGASRGAHRSRWRRRQQLGMSLSCPRLRVMSTLLLQPLCPTLSTTPTGQPWRCALHPAPQLPLHFTRLSSQTFQRTCGFTAHVKTADKTIPCACMHPSKHLGL